MLTVYSSYLKTYVWIPYLCFQLEWLGIYDQNRKTAAILAAILDFGYLQEACFMRGGTSTIAVYGKHIFQNNFSLAIMLETFCCLN